MAFGEKSLIRGIASLNEQFNNILLFVLLKSSLIRGVTFGERVIIWGGIGERVIIWGGIGEKGIIWGGFGERDIIWGGLL